MAGPIVSRAAIAARSHAIISLPCRIFGATCPGACCVSGRGRKCPGALYESAVHLVENSMNPSRRKCPRAELKRPEYPLRQTAVEGRPVADVVAQAQGPV